MTQRSMRGIAVAVALTSVTVLAAPAQAAGRTTLGAPGPDWLEAAIQWMAGHWVAGVWSVGAAAVSAPETRMAPAPSSPTMMAPSPAKTDSGIGIDPDG
jgi:hypothetical protein